MEPWIRKSFWSGVVSAWMRIVTLLWTSLSIYSLVKLTAFPELQRHFFVCLFWKAVWTNSLYKKHFLQLSLTGCPSFSSTWHPPMLVVVLMLFHSLLSFAPNSSSVRATTQATFFPPWCYWILECGSFNLYITYLEVPSILSIWLAV